MRLLSKLLKAASKLAATDLAKSKRLFVLARRIEWLQRTADDHDTTIDLKSLDSIKSFKQRVDFCNKHPKLKRLGSGSSRIAYDMGNGWVLKLAKNDKGIAQNEAEHDGYLQQLDVITKIKDSSPHNYWLVAEKADKCTLNKFRAATGIKFTDFSNVLHWRHMEYHGDRMAPHYKPKDPTLVESIMDNEFYQQIESMMVDTGMPVGDLMRISTYGILRGKVVVVDSGLSQEVSERHYA